jgi:hypothetical protein
MEYCILRCPTYVLSLNSAWFCVVFALDETLFKTTTKNGIEATGWCWLSHVCCDYICIHIGLYIKNGERDRERERAEASAKFVKNKAEGLSVCNHAQIHSLKNKIKVCSQ